MTTEIQGLYWDTGWLDPKTNDATETLGLLFTLSCQYRSFGIYTYSLVISEIHLYIAIID